MSVNEGSTVILINTWPAFIPNDDKLVYASWWTINVHHIVKGPENPLFQMEKCCKKKQWLNPYFHLFVVKPTVSCMGLAMPGPYQWTSSSIWPQKTCLYSATVSECAQLSREICSSVAYRPIQDYWHRTCPEVGLAKFSITKKLTPINTASFFAQPLSEKWKNYVFVRSL